jgi:hypothetical protein
LSKPQRVVAFNFCAFGNGTKIEKRMTPAITKPRISLYLFIKDGTVSNIYECGMLTLYK